MSPATEDPIVDAAIEEALRRYSAIVPPEALEELRRVLRLVGESHPGVQEILRRIRPRPMLAHSDDVRVGGSGEPEKVTDLKKGKGR